MCSSSILQQGNIEHRFDLTESNAVPSTYPIALQISKDGRHAFVALWNASEIVELDLDKAVVGRKLALLKPAEPVKPGTHPCAFALSGGWPDAIRGAGES